MLSENIRKWQERVIEESRRKAVEEVLQEGKQKGLEEGRQKGLEEGRQKGLEEGRQKGLEEGRQKGLEEGKALLLRKQLEKRFGPLPDWAEARLEQVASDELERWAIRLLDAVRLEDVFS